jgi:hypothetical protein
MESAKMSKTDNTSEKESVKEFTQSIDDTSEKASLTGFAKGWVIFMLIYSLANAASLLQYLGRYTGGTGTFLILILFLGGMALGLAFMLKKRASGFWILTISSILFTAMTGSSFAGYTVITSGGLVLVFLTWLFTRKQINYRFWGK